MKTNIRQSAIGNTSIDLGLRSHFNDIFSMMTTAMLISAVFAYIGMKMPILYAGGALTWIVVLSPLAFILALSFAHQHFSNTGLIVMLSAFSAAQGLSLGAILFVFTAHSIVSAFLISTILFATFALFGYTTRRDLSSMGTFLLVGLIGIIIASIANIWLGMGIISFVVNVLAVLIFTGLTAYDMQRLKDLYYQEGDSFKIRLFGALSLYLNFLNIFVSILQLFGKRD